MAYVKNNWVDREGTTRYFETVDDDGALILTPDYTQVTEMGTPVNADNMNHIEEGIAAGSFTKYDSMATYAKNDLVTTIVDNELKVYKSLQDNNTNALDNSSFWEEVEFSGGGGAGLQMFDTILKDHVLTYEESKGLALQGTYVYKEAIAGSRYGYPDFYNKCLEEYQNASDADWVQPVLSSNGVLGGATFAVSASASSDGFSPYQAFDNNTSTDWVSLDNNEDLIIYNPAPIKITQVNIINRNHATYVRPISSGVVYGSNDNSDWQELTSFTNTVTAQLGEWSINLSSNNNSYKYYKFSFVGDGSFCAVNDIKLIATGGGIVRNSNGHIFYDISLKDQIDQIYANTGTAWMYGIDTENERIFLPRNNYFDQATGDVSEVGQGIGAGLPNITGGFTSTVLSPNPDTSAYGAFVGTTTTGASPTGGGGSGSIDTFDASRSSSIYGNSDTVQPNAVKKLLYICVGNTESKSVITEVVDVTTTENDTIPLFTGMYFGFKPNNVSWLIGGGQASNAGIYATCYNELVNVLNGETKYGDLKVVDTADMIAGVDYSEYWKVNQDEMYFITPTKISNKALSGAVVGNGYALGITNGVGEGVICKADTNLLTAINSSLPINLNSSNGTGVLKGYTQYGGLGVSSDPAKSGIIAEESTSQLYFKVANAVQNLELLNAGEVLEAVNGVIPNNRSLIASYGLPDYTAGITTNGTNTVSYTAPCIGWAYVGQFASGTTASAMVNVKINDIVADEYFQGSQYGGVNSRPFFIDKGDVISGTGSTTNIGVWVIFFPLKGGN